MSEEIKALTLALEEVQARLADLREAHALKQNTSVWDNKSLIEQHLSTQQALLRALHGVRSDAKFYRSIVVAIGELFGDAARTDDEGVIQDSVLALRVRELVAQCVEERALLRQARGLPDGALAQDGTSQHAPPGTLDQIEDAIDTARVTSKPYGARVVEAVGFPTHGRSKDTALMLLGRLTRMRKKEQK